MRLFNKKGQGLSLTTIIVAALALIVLVVLVAIFSGKLVPWGSQVSQAADAELIKLKINYGDCHPATAKEAEFKTAMTKASTSAAKDNAASVLKQEISRCKAYTTESLCKSGVCTWK